jgi:lactoylglutathione lyase
MATATDLAGWAKKDKRRMLHVVYRVGDMDATVKYYKDHFGMQQLRLRDIPDEKYTNAFLGFGPEKTNFAVELTYNYGVDGYNIGDGFGHFAIATTDVHNMCAKIKKTGGKV